MSSTKRRWTICAGVPWLGHVIHQLAVHQLARYADHAARQAHLERLDIRTSQVTPDPICIATERALWSSIQAHGMLREIAIVSDGTGQFAVARAFTNLHRAARVQFTSEVARHSQSRWPRLL